MQKKWPTPSFVFIRGKFHTFSPRNDDGPRPAAPELGGLVCLLTDGLDGDTAEEPPAPAHAGERFGDFTLERAPDGSPRELGHGAMGTTYLARDTVLDRPVALKVINAATTIRSGARARFLREHDPADTGNVLPNDVSLTAVCVVPEPSAWTLLGMGAFGLGFALRRRLRACRV